MVEAAERVGYGCESCARASEEETEEWGLTRNSANSKRDTYFQRASRVGEGERMHTIETK